MGYSRAVEVTVDTGSRLHLGFYGLLATTRIYGGVGLAIDKPSFKVRVRYPGAGVVRGCQSERVRRVLREACMVFGGLCDTVDVDVDECVPAHRGFGSTTQLKMSIYTALAVIDGRVIDGYSLARLAGRGKISAIGVGAFMHGGLIVDAGQPLAAKDYTTPVLARLEFPPDWSVVIVVPETDWRVEEGPREASLLSQTVAISEKDYMVLLDTLLRRIMAGVVDRDFGAFAEGVERLQEITGRYFSKAQGGIYCCREAEEAVRLLRMVGGRGVGQSSWGPAVYGFFPSTGQAVEARQRLIVMAEDAGLRLEAVYIAKPRNHGAVVRRRWLVGSFPRN